MNKIITNHLILKSITDQDKSILLEIINNDLVKKTYMLPDLITKEDNDNYFLKLKNLTYSSRFVYGIYLNKMIIGFINEVEKDNDSIELGYFINPKYWNHGYATEALSSCIKELFKRGYKTVYAAHFEHNLASGRVMIKSGMKQIERIEYIEYRGVNHKCIYYSINNNNE